MTMKRKIILLLSAVICFAGCNGKDTKRQKLNSDFIAKYGSENFTSFIGHTIWLRSLDRERNQIFLFNSNNQDTGNCSLPYRVIVSSKSGQMKEANRSWADSFGRCPIDTNIAVEYALKLHKMQIAYLKVDSNKNVIVQTLYGEGTPDLIRFSDPKFITEEFRKRWRPKGNNWYERKEF